MTWRDYAIAVAIAFVWGVAFIVVKYGIGQVPPFTLAALRFAAVALPAVFFVPPPRAPVWVVACYGLAIGFAQFGLAFWAMDLGMPAGLSSLVIQVQVYFTILFAWGLMSERPGVHQAIGGAVALAGLSAIALERTGGAGLWPFLITIAAAAFWGVGNVLGKLARGADMMAFTIWSSLAAPLPLFAASYAQAGPRAFTSILEGGWPLAFTVAFLAYLGTLFGFGLWARLLSRHPAAEVTPFALLVPVFGMGSSWLSYAEIPTAIEFVGAGLVLAGLSWNVFGPRLTRAAER